MGGEGEGREVELCLLDAHVLCSRFSSWAVFGIVRHVIFSLLRSRLPWWTARRRMELALLSQP